MTRTILFTSALAAAVGLFAFGANAQQQTAPVQDQQRLSIAQIAAKLESEGYSILEIDLERGRYDVEMIDGNGLRVEAYFDPVTGAVLSYHDDHFDDDHYRSRYGDDRYDRDDD